MIKCIVTVCGTLSRTAIKRTNREGNPFSTFGIKVIIPDNTGNDKVIEISVAKDGDEDLSMLTIGSRIEVTGVLTFHKKEDNIWLNLSATGINSFNTGNKDSITGDMEFRGTLGKKTIEIKKDKKGKPFKIFFAYSSERITSATENEDAKYAFIWVRFVQFNAIGSDWLAPSVGVNVKGDLNLTVYNNNISLGCRVKELTQWDKTQHGTNA